MHLCDACEPDQALHILGPHAPSSHDADAPARLPHQRCNGCASLPDSTAVSMAATSECCTSSAQGEGNSCDSHVASMRCLAMTTSS